MNGTRGSGNGQCNTEALISRLPHFLYGERHLLSRTIEDSYGEKRFVATGFIGDRLHVMAFTVRSEVIRIISLRKANERERKEYEKNID
jgi:uncharacterized DUF497 family protein